MRLDLLAVIVLLLILVSLAGPVWGVGGCPPPGSVPVHLDADSSGDAPCDSEAPCPADKDCTVCATCCKVAVRAFVPHVARAPDLPGLPLAAPAVAAAGPSGSVWHPPRD